MNHLTKYTYFAAFLIFYSLNAHATLSQQDIERRMTSYHNAAFGGTYIVKDVIPTKNLNDWNMVIADVNAFAQKHTTLNPFLTRAMQMLKDMNNDLVLLIVEGHHHFFKKQSLQKTQLQDIKEHLERVIASADSLKNKLKESITKGYTIHSNQKVATVLHRLAVTISTTAKKALKELSTLP